MTGHVLALVENQPYPYDPRLSAQVKALVSAGYRVTVIGPTGHGHEALSETHPGVRVLRYRAPSAGVGFLAYVREYGLSLVRMGRLVQHVQREDPPDLVLICNPPDALALLAVPLRRRGVGVVFDDRELSPELFEAKFGRRGLVHRALLAAERFAFRQSDAVLVTNRSYTGNVLQRGGLEPDRVFVVGNGPDPDRIYPVPPRGELKKGREHLVLWMGAMSQQEGLEVLIAAAAELVKQRGRTDVTFAIVGPGDVGESLQAEIERRGLHDEVFLPGRVHEDLVRAYLATADVCVGVDVPGPMNDRAAMRKVFEYMAMGRAVVQFPLAEMVRLCGDTTVYARPGDATDLADRIAALLDKPEERQALGRRAQERVAEMHLSWPDQLPALLAAFGRAAERSRARAGSTRPPTRTPARTARRSTRGRRAGPTGEPDSQPPPSLARPGG